jgi:hypothetical protein
LFIIKFGGSDSVGMDGFALAAVATVAEEEFCRTLGT